MPSPESGQLLTTAQGQNWPAADLLAGPLPTLTMPIPDSRSPGGPQLSLPLKADWLGWSSLLTSNSPHQEQKEVSEVQDAEKPRSPLLPEIWVLLPRQGVLT